MPSGAAGAGAGVVGAGAGTVAVAGDDVFAVSAGVFGAVSPASSKIVRGCDSDAFVPMYASARLLIMKMAAKIAVARDSAVLAPRAPNTVPDAPAPKPAPASAPLPR